MKLSYKVSGTSSYTALADESASVAFAASTAQDVIHDFPPAFSSAKLEEPSFGGSGEVRRTQGNAKCVATVVWDAYYADRASAIAAIRLVATALLDKLVHLKLEEGAETQYYPNAIVDNYNPVPQGRTVTHSVTFTSDNVTATAPT